MTIEDKIELVKRNTEEFISQIEKIGFNEDLGLIKFLLVSCLLDSVSAYGYQKRKNNEQYIGFIKDYLGQIDKRYRNEHIAKILYHGIRCSLIHSFSIANNILLTEAADKEIHLATNNKSHLIVDLVTLFDDIKKSIKLFFKDLQSGKDDLQKHFKKGFSKNPPFEIYTNVDRLDPNQPSTGCLTSMPISYKKVNFRRKQFTKMKHIPLNN